MSRFIKHEHQLAVTYHWANYWHAILHYTGISTSCHIPLSKLSTCHASLNRNTN